MPYPSNNPKPGLNITSVEGIQEEMNKENCQELNHLHVVQGHSKFHQPKEGKEREEDFHQLREKQTKSAVHLVKIMPTTQRVSSM